MRFSSRYGYYSDEQNNTFREDAPEILSLVIPLIAHVAGM